LIDRNAKFVGEKIRGHGLRYGDWARISDAVHFLTRTRKRVRTEMSLHVLACNMKRVMAIIGVGPLLQAIRA
jgi:hypothetical protein